MARPNRQGCDYFPLDVHLDDKFKFIEIKYGLEGFALLIKLLQKIYSYGYWYKWTDDEALLFADETRSTYENVNNVVNEALKRGIFDDKLYQSHNILTSTGIQKRYKEIVRRRKDVEVIEDYLLIDGNFGVNDVNNPSPSKQHDGKSTQSKEKEKVKESKPKKKKHLDNVLLTDEEYNRLIEEYGEPAINSKIEDLDTYISNQGKNKYKDHNKTLRNWLKRDGVKPLEEKTKEQFKSNSVDLSDEL